MGCTVRDKHIRTNRRPRVPKSDSDSTDKSLANKLNFQLGFNELSPNSDSNPSFNENSGWGYCTEEQLEEILMKNLDFLYNEAIAKLVALGYDEDVALRAVLTNGHCYGGMDVLTNILHNSLAFLNSVSNGSSNGNEGDCVVSEHVFDDLRQLEGFSLAGMVCLLQQLKPQLSKGDAMWCLLMSDLHVGRASVMEIPGSSSNGNGNGNGDGCSNGESSGPVVSNVEKMSNDSVGVTPALCRFHGGWGFGSGGTADFPMSRFLSYAASELSLQREIECPKRFNLTPSMKVLLKRNVAMFAAGYRAKKKDAQVGPSSLSNGHSSNAIEAVAEKTEEAVKNQEGVNMMLSKFRDMNLEGDTEYVPEDQKDEMILSLMHQIKDLEKQVKERKEWAHQKAMQAARKLSNDLTELKMLRMEREETQRLKQGKPTVEDPTMKRLSEMETALRKASGQVDRANAAVRRLETENAEIRAEMEASKLSASESVNTCLEVARREKKYLKRLLAWEKQRVKLQEDIAAEKRMIVELQEEMVRVEAAKKAAEAKWKQEQKAKERALAQVEEERRLKEATEVNNKRKQEALRSKIELDFQRHKDDLQRLEQELARLKTSTNSDNKHPTNESANETPNGSHPTIARLLHELDNLDNFDEKESGIDRECILCLKDEVSVVFLPCAHQVVCASCNDEYGTKGKATCPICRVVIEQRIRVFGASS
ncbi:putative transcription factor C2H2 family [Helianthus annuus]|uniref:Putative RING/U-box superfamily protein n=1 Tax=Helianthus annuus TaxID=4232 RepID=A0A251UG66_HELAN|nr:MND1-interacting protein 1 [Helianthus annuus]KAF5800972.1 putative transcription factor C2H2 family [Helianthus annuus]KAJ0565272.1 putative transcription factor C2H2 family [Helianthus annuus]KAJ0572285.1 putative transcription factor C2H2 family [Helianthus annuus]KAJ0910390.1 putative transcription factor C2H2 family [Helianthus annuus]